MDTIGKRIVRLMNENDINSNELAKLIGKTQPAVSKYIKDKSIPTAEVIGAIAKVLNVSIDYLVFGTEEYKDLIEDQLLEAFRKLDHKNKVIAAGEIMKLLTMQELTEKKD